jgi:hypothetical protein
MTARRWLAVLLALCLMVPAVPVAAQEEQPADPVQLGQEILNAPVPVADQSVPVWWHRTTVDWRVEQAIWQAYEEFWDMRAKAYSQLNVSLVEPRMAGPALDRERVAIDQMRAHGQAYVVDMEHRAQMLEAAADEGVVYDPYLNRSYYIDLASKQRIGGEAEPQTVEIACRLQPVDGVWKVTDAVRLVDEAP